MKSSFFYLIYLAMLLINVGASADPMPEPDSTYTSNIKESSQIIGDSLMFYRQETIQINLTRPVELKAAYAIPENTHQDLRRLWQLRRMIGEEPDTNKLESYEWHSAKLLPPWRAPVLSGEYIICLLTFNPKNESFAYSVYLFGLLALLGFSLFWIIRNKAKEKHFHPLGWVSIIYYLCALIFINLMVTYQGSGWFLMFTVIGIMGSFIFAFFSPLESSGDTGGLMFIVHGLLLALVYVTIYVDMLLPETNFSYFHFNLLLIIYIACGKLLAYLMLLAGKLFDDRFGNKEEEWPD